MKTYYIKEGGTKYQLAENAGDLNIVRLTELKNMIAENSSGMDFPDLIQWFSDRRPFYNTSDIYSLMTGEINMVQKIETMSDSIFHDSAQIIFSIMTLEEGELAHEWDKTKAKEKLSRMAEEGLTQGEVWKYTENFIIASPQLCNSFFLMSLVAHKKRQKYSEPSQDFTLEAQEQEELRHD